MRPGPHPWATNDTYAGGPDVGSNSKTETGTVQRADGYYRTRRPAPDLLNWQLNRGYLGHKFTAKLMACNMRTGITTALLGGDTMDGSTCVRTAPYNRCCFYFFDAAGNLNELYTNDGLSCTAPASNPIAAAVGAGMTAIDADADDSAGDRVIVVTGVNDQVYTANGFAGGAWGISALGAPALNWNCVGCDRNSAGGANARFLIGDDAGGGNAVLYASTNGGANFANVATFPAVAEPILFIGHTCHHANALGPDDAGNPSWLVLTTTRALVSADGATWSNQAHGFGVAPSGPKSCAYSRTAGRWVFVNTNDIWYSDDNGVTWTASANALGTVLPVNPVQIKTDAHGTFLVTGDTSDRLYWTSVDDGITWTIVPHVPAAAAWGGPPNDTKELEIGWYSQDFWSSTGDSVTHFVVLFHDQGAPLQEPYRTLFY